jgi:hypothetical protein
MMMDVLQAVTAVDAFEIEIEAHAGWGPRGGKDQRGRFTGFGGQREQRSGRERTARLAGAAYQSSLAL